MMTKFGGRSAARVGAANEASIRRRMARRVGVCMISPGMEARAAYHGSVRSVCAGDWPGAREARRRLYPPKEPLGIRGRHPVDLLNLHVFHTGDRLRDMDHQGRLVDLLLSHRFRSEIR